MDKVRRGIPKPGPWSNNKLSWFGFESSVQSISICCIQDNRFLSLGLHTPLQSNFCWNHLPWSKMFVLTSTRKWHITFRTLTVVFSGLIDALAYAANSRVFNTFVYIHTDVTSFVEFETFVARTHETSERICTVTILAEVLMFFTFVDVLQHNLKNIRERLFFNSKKVQ